MKIIYVNVEVKETMSGVNHNNRSEGVTLGASVEADDDWLEVERKLRVLASCEVARKLQTWQEKDYRNSGYLQCEVCKDWYPESMTSGNLCYDCRMKCEIKKPVNEKDFPF